MTEKEANGSIRRSTEYLGYVVTWNSGKVGEPLFWITLPPIYW